MDCRKDKGQNKSAGRLDFLIVLSKDAILRQANHWLLLCILTKLPPSSVFSERLASTVRLIDA